jgi:hypothetical protein
LENRAFGATLHVPLAGSVTRSPDSFLVPVPAYRMVRPMTKWISRWTGSSTGPPFMLVSLTNLKPVRNFAPNGYIFPLAIKVLLFPLEGLGQLATNIILDLSLSLSTIVETLRLDDLPFPQQNSNRIGLTKRRSRSTIPPSQTLFCLEFISLACYSCFCGKP